MEEKIVISAFVLMHLTKTDFVTAFVGWLLRAVFDWYNAKHKVNFRGQRFTSRRYLRDNLDRLIVSSVFGLGLLLILPEVVILVLSTVVGHEVKWNSGFSGLIGLLAFEIVSALQKGSKRRLTRLISGEEMLSMPGEAEAAEAEAETSDDQQA